jgi:ABC-type glycerol-3-phosphate transport system substrate-binding protein
MGQTDIGWSATKYAEGERAAVAEFMHYAMSPEVISKDPGRVTSVPGIDAPNHLTAMASEVLGMAEHITFWWDQDLPPELPPPLQDTLQAFFIPDADVQQWLDDFEALAVDALGPVQ